MLGLACAHAGGDAWRSPVARDHPLVGVLWDVRARSRTQPEALVDALARSRFALLGEKHDNADHHRLQARLVTALAERGVAGAVAFEMLREDVAPALAAAQAGPDASAATVRSAVDWDASGWPDWELYAPVFEAALAADLPVVAADLALATQRRLGRQGAEALAPEAREALGLARPLPEAQRSALAEQIRESHCGHAPEAMIPRMIDVQRARDARLASALVAAAEAVGDGVVLLVAGGEHVRRDRGVPVYLALRAPGAPVASVLFAEVDPELREAGAALRARYGDDVPFDFVWFTPRVDALDPCEHFARELEALGRGPHAP